MLGDELCHCGSGQVLQRPVMAYIVEYLITDNFRAYQTILDDSPPTLATSFNSFLSALRPDRAFASAPVDAPREMFKDQYADVPLIAYRYD